MRIKEMSMEQLLKMQRDLNDKLNKDLEALNGQDMFYLMMARATVNREINKRTK